MVVKKSVLLISRFVIACQVIRVKSCLIPEKFTTEEGEDFRIYPHPCGFVDHRFKGYAISCQKLPSLRNASKQVSWPGLKNVTLKGGTAY